MPLYDIARSPDKRPFFLQVSYTHPHEPYLCRKEFWDLYQDVDIPLPRVGAMTEAQHDAHSVRLLRDFGMLDVRFSDEDIRRARRAYYGSISYIDSMIGRILDTLAATGADGNTAIFFASDHGEMLGERGMWFKKHFFEPALRVPLMLKAPGVAPQRVAEPVSLVDLLPTFMGLAEGTTWSCPVEELDGRDLGTLLKQPAAEPSRAVYAEYLAEATPSPIFMIRRGRYKYIASAADPALLFDLLADPEELNNLAEEPEFAKVASAFAAEIRNRWDDEALSQRIEQSQRRRLLILASQREGRAPRWNHDETPREEVVWYRGQGSYNEWAFAYLPVDEGGRDLGPSSG